MISTLHRAARRQRVDDRAELAAGEAQDSRGEVLGAAERQRLRQAPRRHRRRYDGRLREHEGLDALDALVLGEDVFSVVVTALAAVLERALDIALVVGVLFIKPEVVDAWSRTGLQAHASLPHEVVA